mmetsp:Transcript_19729/g.29549  ORF Transcript_19729/g.29549 Transcript_19729/m.29549 type:complete len:133 (+) Transcript_19729:164-562(+)
MSGQADNLSLLYNGAKRTERHKERWARPIAAGEKGAAGSQVFKHHVCGQFRCSSQSGRFGGTHIKVIQCKVRHRFSSLNAAKSEVFPILMGQRSQFADQVPDVRDQVVLLFPNSQVADYFGNFAPGAESVFP